MSAVASLDRTVVLLASGGLSHRFWPLREIRNHETAALENRAFATLADAPAETMRSMASN